MSLITFGIINNQVTYKNTLEIPFSICCPTLRDDKLFGFERGYLKNLIEFSLTDQTSRKHKIQEENQPKDYWYIPNGHVWIEDELLVAVYNMKNDMSTILLFDFFGLKWKKTKYELKGRITDMSYSNGALFIVNITHVNSETRFYQFQYHVAESLTNLTLKAIRQYLRHNPQFYEWFQSKLAKNSKIRTLW
ncbi:hypothetical protein M3Y95_00915800 [Aphelenchoides besseyi]|nr:hypothetical protein M3Y95_00915800 [Aphelenchoides besseyi]